MRKYSCKSVLGGWQTIENSSEKLFGPIFNKINDLWDWQLKNLELDTE
jgi:hypothetical protein